MIGSPDLFGQFGPLAQAGDAVYTPDWCARDMVEHFQPSGRILEPCRGGGAFMRFLPADALWCEIKDGRDFFAWDSAVDWIITNPPYSLTREFLHHSLSVAENVVFLLPARNIFSGYGTVRECAGWGGMAAIRWYGTGSLLGFPMGNAIAAIHWKRGHSGNIRESFFEDEQRARLDGMTLDPDRSPASDALVKAAVAYDEAAAEIRRALLAMGAA